MKLDPERIKKATERFTALLSGLDLAGANNAQLEVMREEWKKDLPDLPDDLLLDEARSLLATCQPLHKTPSSARMRRVLRAAVKLLEEKIEANHKDRP